MSTDATSGSPSTRTGDDEALAARRAAAEAANEATRAAFAHERGIAYGSHPQQRLDLYLPSGTPTGQVLVFLHGGGFTVGDPGSVAYHGHPYLERGAIFVAMGYRLAPDARFPECADDVEAGLAHLAAHVGDHGGDPGRIYLSGHSAGAMLAATVGLRPSSAIPADLVKGLVLISGMYDFTHHREEIVDRQSPRYVPRLLDAIERVPDHTIVVSGDHDFPAVLPDAHAMTDAVRAHGGSAEMFVEPDADHFQANRSFVTAGGTVFEATAAMMKL